MSIDITESEAQARLQKLSAERKAAKLTAPKILERLLAARETLVTLRLETLRLAQTKIERCMPDGTIHTEVVAGVLGTPGKDKIRRTNTPALKNRDNHLYAAIIKIDNSIHEARRIIFNRTGFSQQRFDQAIAAATIPADPDAYLESLLSMVPVADPNVWTIIAAHQE
jgi:hypothetical protein